MTELDPTVERFVERHLEFEEGAETHLDDFWGWYGPPGNGVPREKFKWHLIQALPESVEVAHPNTFIGVGIRRPAP